MVLHSQSWYRHCWGKCIHGAVGLGTYIPGINTYIFAINTYIDGITGLDRVPPLRQLFGLFVVLDGTILVLVFDHC